MLFLGLQNHDLSYFVEQQNILFSCHVQYYALVDSFIRWLLIHVLGSYFFHVSTCFFLHITFNERLVLLLDASVSRGIFAPHTAIVVTCASYGNRTVLSLSFQYHTPKVCSMTWVMTILAQRNFRSIHSIPISIFMQ